MSGSKDDDEDGPLWPRPVQMVKDDRKKMRLIMSVEEMPLTKPFIGRPKPLSTNTILLEAKSSEITLRFEILKNDGSTKVYEYKKKLPLDILPDKTLQSIQYRRSPKGALVEVSLWKAKEASWAEHTRYLTTRGKQD